MRELRVAESAGFCFGVRRSVEMAEKLLAEESSLVSLGDLIHNRDVVGALQEKGLRVASAPEEVPFSATVILRAHGVSREMIPAVRNQNSKTKITRRKPYVNQHHPLQDLS